MHAHGQYVFAFTQLEQLDPQQRPAQQIEGLLQLGTHLLLDVCGCRRREIEGDRGLVENLLIERAVL